MLQFVYNFKIDFPHSYTFIISQFACKVLWLAFVSSFFFSVELLISSLLGVLVFVLRCHKITWSMFLGESKSLLVWPWVVCLVMHMETWTANHFSCFCFDPGLSIFCLERIRRHKKGTRHNFTISEHQCNPPLCFERTKSEMYQTQKTDKILVVSSNLCLSAVLRALCREVTRWTILT